MTHKSYRRGPGVLCDSVPVHGGVTHFDSEVTCEKCRARLEEHARVKTTFPDAIWMPWDDPPVGARVLRTSSLVNKTGTVVGVFQSKRRKPHDCPSCACDLVSEYPELDGWWLVDLDEPMLMTGKDGATSWRVPRALEYPPALRRLEDKA